MASTETDDDEYSLSITLNSLRDEIVLETRDDATRGARMINAWSSTLVGTVPRNRFDIQNGD